MAFGTKFSLETAAAKKDIVADIDMDAIWENLDGYFAAHNMLFLKVMEIVAEMTTDRVRRYGDAPTHVMQELEEFGQPSAQKVDPTGYNVGFPLRRFGNVLQWTEDYFQNLSVDEFEKQVNAITSADEAMLYRELRRALFYPTNVTFTDWQVMPAQDLPVKRLINADSTTLPVNPVTGASFDGSTHTHYTGVTTGNAPTQAEAVTFVENIEEHFASGEVVVYVNKAEVADILAFTDFKPYVDARLINQTTAIVASPDQALDVMNSYDRPFGILHNTGAEFHVKPWVPAGYWFGYVRSANISPPLVLRQHPREALQGLRLVANDANHPLYAREYEHRFGVGVWNRVNGAVLDVATGSTNFTAPTIN